MTLSIDAPTPTPVPTVWAYSDPSSDAAFSPVVWLPLTFLLTTCLLFISLRRAYALRLYADAQDWLRTKYPWIFSSHIRLPGRSDRTSASSRPHRRSSRPSPAASSLQADLSDDENATANHMLSPDNDDGDDDLDDLDDLDGDELPFSTTSSLYQSSSVRPMWNKAVDSSRSFLNTLGWGDGAGVGSNQGRDGMARAFWGIPKKDRIGTIRLGSTAASGAAPRSGTGPSSGGLSGVAGLLGRITDLAGRSRNDAYLPVDRQSRSRGNPQTTLFDLERGDEEHGDDAVELPPGFMLESVVSTGKPSA
ncbi:BQ5605_C001g00613 [Microbotryum silenes-dioicae]|uniref:BQ5605_C001g00613 protein n=1 Tax=Microbotryum silenes-dioicae TaxID=796604 RepID=A0A2X0M3W9_9BASI|nr:BQ5605_C001g00613 [Microbotryum silenes-dioicae]